MKTLEQVKAEYLAEAQTKTVGKYVVFNSEGKVEAFSDEEFPFSFDGETWITAELNTRELFQSRDGGYYELKDLPENSDDFAKDQYAIEVKAERNARIRDTDAYVQLSDKTVQRGEGEKRTALTETERAELIQYRAQLRDFPLTEGFPFCEFPAFPSALNYELSKKSELREIRNGVINGL
jgi:hypothetical protein